ncbi:hypothetical protein FQN57_003365 [Myotisia sp. PD_48]|nr:hypothetical protein FQN57_003365 [Myotisia sp. PD_48]
MSSKIEAIPDAWDDEWETLADNQESGSSTPLSAQSEKKVSSRAAKALRRAQHAEFNRQLWADAESNSQPQGFPFLESRSPVPMKSDYKAPFKVLARKPPPDSSKSSSPSTGFDSIVADEEDSDAERQRLEKLNFEERLAKVQREREEKQRKYDEARERLFGTSDNLDSSRQRQPHSDDKGKGRNRSTGRARDASEKGDRSSTPNKSKQRYDPNISPKPDANYIQRKDGRQDYGGDVYPKAPSLPQSAQPQAPIRTPRGPDSSGAAGFGFSQHKTRGG